MSDNWINIRLGLRNFIVKKWFKGISFKVNPYLQSNKPSSYFAVYDFFGLV